MDDKKELREAIGGIVTAIMDGMSTAERNDIRAKLSDLYCSHPVATAEDITVASTCASIAYNKSVVLCDPSAWVNVLSVSPDGTILVADCSETALESGNEDTKGWPTNIVHNGSYYTWDSMCNNDKEQAAYRLEE